GRAFWLGEGCELATAAEGASFGLSELTCRGFRGGCVSKSLANLFRPRDALFYGLTGRRFDGKAAAAMGFVNYAVPLARLKDETMAVARDIAGKDPAALRATQEGYRFSLEMTWEASMNYTGAKEEEPQNRQSVGWKDSGVRDFVEGKFKPGLQSHEQIKQ